MSNDIQILQSMVVYYRGQCSNLELEFLEYKLETEKRIRELEQRLATISREVVGAEGSIKE